MTVALPPHHPTPGELDAAHQMDLPTSDAYVNAMLELAVRADKQGKPQEAINVLRAAVLARPDDWQIYEALGGLYRDLGHEDDAAVCFSESRVLRDAKP